MTWITPVTDWSNGNRFTFADMNRIAGNINEMYPSANLKADYTQNDYLTVSEWDALTSALTTLVNVSGLKSTVVGYDGTAETFAQIEQLTQDLYDRLALNRAQAPATIYAGDDLYTASPVENYVRGV